MRERAGINAASGTSASRWSSVSLHVRLSTAMRRTGPKPASTSRERHRIARVREDAEIGAGYCGDVELRDHPREGKDWSDGEPAEGARDPAAGQSHLNRITQRFSV